MTTKDNQPDTSDELDEIFENYRVLIMNGIQQGLSYADIATGAELEAKAKLQALLTASNRELLDKVGSLIGEIRGPDGIPHYDEPTQTILEELKTNLEKLK